MKLWVTSYPEKKLVRKTQRDKYHGEFGGISATVSVTVTQCHQCVKTGDTPSAGAAGGDPIYFRDAAIENLCTETYFQLRLHSDAFALFAEGIKGVPQTRLPFLERHLMLKYAALKFEVFNDTSIAPTCTASKNRFITVPASVFFFGARIWLLMTFNYPVLWVRVKGQG